jgi:hypothetical protein
MQQRVHQKEFTKLKKDCQQLIVRNKASSHSQAASDRRALLSAAGDTTTTDARFQNCDLLESTPLILITACCTFRNRKSNEDKANAQAQQVTDSLRRTRKLMAQQVQNVVAVSEVLGDHISLECVVDVF